MDGLALEITYPRKLNWSLLRAGIPPVWDLHLHNEGDAPVEGLSLRLEVGDFLGTKPLPLPTIAPRSKWTLDPGDLRVDADYPAAVRLLEPVTAGLDVRIGECSVQLPLDCLTADEWCAGVRPATAGYEVDGSVEVAEARFPLPAPVDPKDATRAWTGEPPLQAAAAALVIPEDPQITQIKAEGMAGLASITGDPRVSLVDWSADTPEQRTQVMQAMFMALHRLYPNAYHDVERSSLERWSQRIRFSETAVGGSPLVKRGATCVDYALLTCAVFEACGLAPLFVLVGDGEFCHAMVGCWLKDPPAPSPLLDAAEFSTAVNDERLLAIDVTEFSKGRTFLQACDLARHLGPVCYALDIQAARERFGIAPLPVPLEPPPSYGRFAITPEVRSAINHAFTAALDWKDDFLSTPHLLLGLASIAGGLLNRQLHNYGVEPKAFRDAVKRSLKHSESPAGEETPHPRPTEGWRTVFRQAEEVLVRSSLSVFGHKLLRPTGREIEEHHVINAIRMTHGEYLGKLGAQVGVPLQETDYDRSRRRTPTSDDF